MPQAVHRNPRSLKTKAKRDSECKAYSTHHVTRAGSKDITETVAPEDNECTAAVYTSPKKADQQRSGELRPRI